MGECGCGNFHNGRKLPGPDGSIYAIRRYSGCDNCDTQVAILIARFRDPKEAASWGVDKDPELTFGTIGGEDYEGQEAWIDVLDVDVLRDAMRNALTEEIAAYRADKMDPFEFIDDLIENCVTRSIIAEAMFATKGRG